MVYNYSRKPITTVPNYSSYVAQVYSKECIVNGSCLKCRRMHFILVPSGRNLSTNYFLHQRAGGHTSPSWDLPKAPWPNNESSGKFSSVGLCRLRAYLRHLGIFMGDLKNTRGHISPSCFLLNSACLIHG